LIILAGDGFQTGGYQTYTIAQFGVNGGGSAINTALTRCVSS
jgi:hypothetical protein